MKDPDVILEPVNSAYIRVNAESDIVYELADAFSFYAPNYKFHPKYKFGQWDGLIRLLDRRSGMIYAGLRKEIERYCDKNSISHSAPNLPADQEFTLSEAEAFVKGLELPEKIQLRDYQFDTFVDCVRARRALYLSPTSSGKSLIIYLLMRYYQGKKLIIVPTTSLVEQMAGDFYDYGYKGKISKIYAGKDHENLEDITISTWQSCARFGREWFQRFLHLVGDEAHRFNARSLVQIGTQITRASTRFGFTGSLDGSKTNQLVLEGLFGPLQRRVSTADLVNAGHIAKPNVRCLQLRYPEDIRKASKALKYQDEKKFLVNHEGRNRFIKNLALSLDGNVMVLFQYVQDHGKPLYESIREEAGSRNVSFVSGEVDTGERETIRLGIEPGGSSITVASAGVFSTGINIPGINHIIFASPSKSRILIMQMIGRGLRLAKGKTSFTLFDIADDLRWKKHNNYTYNHFVERLRYYSEEQFDYKITRLDLN